MSMTFVPVNQKLWTKGNALVYGYADPYNPRQKREPDAMIMKESGDYLCAIGPDWNQEFVAKATDPDVAKYECLMAWGKRTWNELAAIKKTPARPAAASPC